MTGDGTVEVPRDEDPANLAISFRALAEMTNLPLARVDPVRRTFRYVSPAFCTMMGLPEEQLVGRLSWDMLAPDQRATITESSVFFLRQYRANPWVLSLHPDGGRKLRAIFYMTQVTWSDGSADTLLRLVETPVPDQGRPSNLLEKTLPAGPGDADSAPVGVWTQSLLDGPWTVNETMYDIFGMPRPDPATSELTMPEFELAKFIHPDDLPELALIIQEGTLTPTIVNTTARIVRLDGVQRTIEIFGQTYSRDGDGTRPTHSLGLIRDITDRIYAQEASNLVLSFTSGGLTDSRGIVERALKHLTSHAVAEYAAFYLVDDEQRAQLIHAEGSNAWSAVSTDMLARSIRTSMPTYFPEFDSRTGAAGVCSPITVEGRTAGLLVILRPDPFPDSFPLERVLTRIDDWLETHFRAFGLPSPG